MNACKPLTLALLLLALAGHQTSGSARDSTPPPESAEDAAPLREYANPVAGGGRWAAALEASDDPRTVYVLDQETDWVYEIGGDARVTLERLEWLEKDALEIHGAGDSLVLQILPPEPDTTDASPRFQIMTSEIYRAVNASGFPQGESFTTYGPAPGNSTVGGSLTVGSIHTMKDRLKRESYQRRGSRVPRNNQ